MTVGWGRGGWAQTRLPCAGRDIVGTPFSKESNFPCTNQEVTFDPFLGIFQTFRTRIREMRGDLATKRCMEELEVIFVWGKGP